MSLRISCRPASADEIALLGRVFLPPWAYACRVAAGTYLLWWFVGFGLLMLVGTVASVLPTVAPALAGVMTSAWEPWKERLLEVVLVAVLWGPVFLLPLLVAVRRGRAALTRRRALWADRRDRLIEVIAIEDEPCTVIDAGKAGRFHLFSLDAGQTLCLADDNHALQVEFERMLAEQEEADPLEEGFDEALQARLPMFPSSRFEIHRWPRHGMVVALASSGTALEPEVVLDPSALDAAPRRHLIEALLSQSARLPLERDAFRSARREGS